MTEPRTVTVQVAAEALGISEKSVRREIAAGHLRSLKYGTRRLVPTAALDEWVQARLDGAA